MRKPEPPAEAVLIRLVRQASGKTAGETARAGGLSKSRLSQVEAGHQGTASGYRATTIAGGPLARIAAFLGITAAELEEAGRHDAAEVLRMIDRRPPRAGQVADPRPAELRDIVTIEDWDDDRVQELWSLATMPADTKRGLVIYYLRGKQNARDAEVTDLRRAAR